MSRRRINTSARRRQQREIMQRKSYEMVAESRHLHEQRAQGIDAVVYNKPPSMVGVYDFGLPPLSSCPKGAHQINREKCNGRFAVEMAKRVVIGKTKQGETIYDTTYLGLFDPSK